MRTIADWENGTVKNEILKIANGYIVHSYGLAECNKGYDYAEFKKDKEDAFNLFRTACNLANGSACILYGMESIHW